LAKLTFDHIKLFRDGSVDVFCETQLGFQALALFHDQLVLQVLDASVEVLLNIV